MELDELLSADRIILDLRPRNKVELLRELSRRAAPFTDGMPAETIERALTEREQLGSTGLGKGFALPHARIDGLRDFVALCVRLARPIDFQAVDERPVDLVVVLLLPGGAENGHIQALATISRRFRDESVLLRLRRAADADAAWTMLTTA
jgi:nitrogen PTS system EIIA component